MRLCSLLLGCLVLASAGGAAAADYRYQAMIDFGPSQQAGCRVITPAAVLDGQDVRVVAVADRTHVRQVILEACRSGAWREIERTTADLPLAVGQGEQGSDVIEWTLPRIRVEPQRDLSIRLLAENTATAAFDRFGAGADFSPLALALAQPAFAIPTLQLPALAVLLLAMLWLARRHRGMGVVPAAALLLLGGLLLGQAGSPPIGNAVAGKTDVSGVAQDAANDVPGGDAAIDLLRAQVAVQGEHIRFHVEVNNIEDDQLPVPARLLFLGNSLTYSNDLPAMVQAIAAQAGKQLTVHSVTEGGASLEDLFRAGRALREIASGGYQRVVMQQGPSSLPDSQVDLRYWAAQFNAPIRASGGKPALYMVWPDATRLAFFDEVRESYRNAALDIDGMFIPAGETWRAAWREDPRLALYDSDRFHPSTLGSYAAALSIFAELYGQTPVGLPATLTLANGRRLQLDVAAVAILQRSAWAAHLEFGRRGH